MPCDARSLLRPSVLALSAPLFAALPVPAEPLLDDGCTSLLVTKEASADGSVMIVYTNDAEYHPRLRRIPAADHAPGSFVAGLGQGRVAEVPHTYAVVGWVNEHQLAIGESTFGGRPELVDSEGFLDYDELMLLALERARTAREAIDVMAGLVAAYGYRSSGESISIGDPEEAWLLEIVGRGPGQRGAEWVAVRIPAGHICAHANKARIGEFPLDDPENCRHSEGVIATAVERGWWDPASGAPFRFCDAYCPPTPAMLRITETRVWSLYRRAAPSRAGELDPAYHRGVPGAAPYPLSIAPDAKLSLADVFALMRDHYEGTDFDMTKGIDAGPFGNPFRVRPLDWAVDGVAQVWERPISAQHTACSFVSQSRAWLPDAVGGVMWYGVEDTNYTCYAPLYCCIDALPASFTTGSIDRYSRDSAWWVFNFVANYSYLMYSEMIGDIRAVQSELEGHHLALQPAVEQTAVELARTNPDLLVRYLTDYSVTHAELVVERYRALGDHLITRFNDGFVGGESRGYPEAWRREVVEARPDRYRVPAGVPEGESYDGEGAGGAPAAGEGSGR
ncbi:MAG: C69 family dipeptidase [Planctomycetota bacterium]